MWTLSLGVPIGCRSPRKRGPYSTPVHRLAQARKKAVETIEATADQHAANVLPLIEAIKRAGATTLRDIADALNARGVATARGGRWYAMTVSNVSAVFRPRV